MPSNQAKASCSGTQRPVAMMMEIDLMEKLEPLKKGDDVRVKVPTHDGYLWHAAEVICSKEDHILVETAAGIKLKIPHGEDRYERVAQS